MSGICGKTACRVGYEHEVGDIAVSYGSPTYYEFTLEDFRVETTGLVYSALVKHILDGKLTVRVPEGAAQSTEDGQQSTAAVFQITVDAPKPEAPTGTNLWSAEMTVGEETTDARGYIDPALTIWDITGTVGSLSTSTFTYSGNNYVVGELSYVSAWDMVILITCPGLEGADGTIDLYLDDPDDGDQDHRLTFDPDEVRKHSFTRTLNGAEVSCIEYAWQPKQVDWALGSTVNARIVE